MDFELVLRPPIETAALLRHVAAVSISRLLGTRQEMPIPAT